MVWHKFNIYMRIKKIGSWEKKKLYFPQENFLDPSSSTVHKYNKRIRYNQKVVISSSFIFSNLSVKKVLTVSVIAEGSTGFYVFYKKMTPKQNRKPNAISCIFYT